MTALNRRSRRAYLKTLAAAGLIGAGGLNGLIREALANAAQPSGPGLFRIKGDVRLNGQPAKEGMPVLPGDEVTTGRGAEAVYIIGDNAFMQREDSVVRFGKDAVQGFFRLVTGKLLSVFGPGDKKLLTPTASIGIRGTGCYLEAEPKKVYFCLCYGLAELSPLAEPGRKERIETRHHDHPLMIHHDVGMPSMADAAVINHTDAELILLESLTGRRPPFYGSSNYY